nr:non-ribosomal peptide synthetase [Paenibacillus sp. CF095]
MRKKTTMYPLTHPQKRIWYIDKIYPQSPLHNIGGVIWIHGEVDLELLEKAILHFIQKHEGIRMEILEVGEGACQYIKDDAVDTLKFHDFSKYSDAKKVVSDWAEKELAKPFNLLEQPLYEFMLIKASEQLNGYFIKLHHIISDGWSIQILTREVNEIYIKLRKGDPVELDPKNRYSNYVVKEQEYLSSARFEKNKRFWLEKFQDFPENFLQKTSNELVGKRKTFWVKESLTQSIKSYIQQKKVSTNTFFLSLVLLYQYKMSQQNELIIGTPVLNRSGVKEKQTFGMFTSVLPFRINVEGEGLAADFISRVNKDLKECYFHQRYPYDLLVKELKLRQNGYEQLFQICVNYYNTKLDGECDGNIVENEELYCGEQLYLLQLIIKEWDETGKLEIKIDYQLGDYTDENIEKMFERLMFLSEQIVGFEERSVNELRITTEYEDIKYLKEWNDTEESYPKEMCVHQLIAIQALKTPQNTAAILGNQSLTYRELNDYADRLAQYLVSEGTGKSDIVALLFTHSFETLISLLAVLKVGAAYLPIDTSYPDQRIHYILEDSRAAILLCNINLPEETKYRGKVQRVDRLMLDHLPVNEMLPVHVLPEDLAYIIYTSGSTGNPKGVLVKHQGLMNYAWWARQAYYSDEKDIAALYSSLAFDLTITSIFPPLIAGNAIAIYPDTEKDFILERILDDNIATVLKLTPTHLSLIRDRDNGNSAVRILVVGGENLTSAVAADIHTSFNGQVILINEYGPTETVVGCITHRFDSSVNLEGSVPIGRPISNTKIYILDDQMQPVPEGMIGEIYISGDGVAAGYLRRPELTNQHFLRNKFIGQGTMYKTDDLAIRLSDGSIQYLGRKDSQIKLNGYRIELGEIENNLTQVGGIRDAVVTTYLDNHGKTALTAYLVANSKDMDTLTVRQALLKKVPSYMVPQYLMFLDELPITANGKIDKDSLPGPENVPLSFTTDELSEEELGITFDLLKSILQTDHISLHDNFFQLGGDSIKAIQLMSRLNDVGLDIQVKDILAFPVIGELMVLIRRKKRFNLNRSDAEGAVQRTPIIDWFFALNLTNPHYYLQSVPLFLKPDITPEQIKRAVMEITIHHDTLRLKLDPVSGLLHYNNELYESSSYLEIVSSNGYTEDEKEELLGRHWAATKQSINLETGPLFRCLLFPNAIEQKTLLIITAHHVVIDAVSWRILLEDLNRILNAIVNEAPLPQLIRTDSYQDWAASITNFIADDVINEKEYWRNIVNSFESPLEVDYEAEGSKLIDTITKHATLSTNETVQLLTSANLPYNTRVVDLVIAALMLTCNHLYKKSYLTIEMESHGREPNIGDVDLSRTIGWFTSIYPVKLNLPDTMIGEQLKSIKEQLRTIPNQGMGFGMLKLEGLVKSLSKRTIRFNYLGEIDDWNIQGSLCELADYDTGEEQDPENQFTPLLDMMLYVQNKQFHMKLTYSSKEFSYTSIDQFINQYVEQLQRLIHHCCEKENLEFTPSDFNTIKIDQCELDSLFL